MHAALLSLSQRSDLLAQCDAVARQGKGPDSSQDNNTTYVWSLFSVLRANISFWRYRSLIREFIQQLLAVGIVEYAFAVSIDPMMVNDPRTRLQSEAFDHGCSIEVNYHTILSLLMMTGPADLSRFKTHFRFRSRRYFVTAGENSPRTWQPLLSCCCGSESNCEAIHDWSRLLIRHFSAIYVTLYVPGSRALESPNADIVPPWFRLRYTITASQDLKLDL